MQNGRPLRPGLSGQGRFDLMPPGTERRVAQIFERDALQFGPRDWESGTVPLSEFLNIARHALTRLHEGDKSEDWPARTVWAMLCLMHTQAMIASGRFSAQLADVALPDPHLFLAPGAPMPTSAAVYAQAHVVAPPAPQLPPPAPPQLPPAPPPVPPAPPVPPGSSS